MRLEQAAQQLLDCFENGLIDLNAVTALREALDHFANADKMIGCAYCNNPLFAGTKCNNCGQVTLAKQKTVSSGLCGGCAKKAADGWALYCVECWEKAEQEPVAYNPSPTCIKHIEGMPVGTPLYTRPVRTKDLTDDEIKEIWSFGNGAIYFARAVIAAYREKNK